MFSITIINNKNFVNYLGTFIIVKIIIIITIKLKNYQGGHHQKEGVNVCNSCMRLFYTAVLQFFEISPSESEELGPSLETMSSLLNRCQIFLLKYFLFGEGQLALKFPILLQLKHFARLSIKLPNCLQVSLSNMYTFLKFELGNDELGKAEQAGFNWEKFLL